MLEVHLTNARKLRIDREGSEISFDLDEHWLKVMVDGEDGAEAGSSYAALVVPRENVAFVITDEVRVDGAD